MIDSRQLRHVLTIAREGSFSRAAEVLSLSQPALSTSISRLEDLLGVQLFARGRQGAVLTNAGRSLVLYAEQMENILQSAEDHLRFSEAAIAGPLIVGGTPLALQSIVPAAIARLTHEHSPVAVNVIEATDDELTAGLQNFEIDLVVSTINIGAPQEDIEERALFKSEISAICRPDHPLAKQDKLSLSQLSGHQLALPMQVGTYGIQLKALFMMADWALPKAVIYTSTFASLREVILQSQTITLVPTQIVKPDIERGLLVAVPIRESSGNRTFGLRRSTERKLSALAQRFCDILQDIGPSYNAR